MERLQYLVNDFVARWDPKEPLGMRPRLTSVLEFQSLQKDKGSPDGKGIRT